MDLVLMGPPGVGKGTQAALLRDRLGLVHVSTGEVLRRHVADRTPLGEAAHGHMLRGGLVPDELVTAMALDLVGSARCRAGVLLDGFPRTLAQARALDDALSERHRRVDAVLWFSAPEDLLVQRLTGRRTCSTCGTGYHVLDHPPAVADVCDACGAGLVRRADDDEATARARLHAYTATAAPVRAHYESAGVLRYVDATGTVTEVAALLPAALDGVVPMEDASARS